jgi:hypothetical protein
LDLDFILKWFVCTLQKVTKNRCQRWHLLLVRLKDFNKTKRRRHCLWCGDDTYALGWGVIKPQAMVQAKAAHHHGDTGLPQ